MNDEDGAMPQRQATGVCRDRCGLSSGSNPAVHSTTGLPIRARCKVDNHKLTDWRRRITGFLTVTALLMLGIVYGTMMLGLIVMALIGFMVKWFWFRRHHRQLDAGWKETIIEGEYQVLEQSIGRRGDTSRR
jgi:hypothetical protein